MKILTLAAAAAIGLSGMAVAGDLGGPTVMTDIQLDLIVAGKKPQNDKGNGNDTGGDDAGENWVWNLDHDKKEKNVLQDYDSGDYSSGSNTNKNLTCVDYGYIDANGDYVATNLCNGDTIN